MEIQKIRELCKRAYREGRDHQHFSTTPSIREGYSMYDREVPDCFEATEVFDELDELEKNEKSKSHNQ